jgi:hypothetical protein
MGNTQQSKLLDNSCVSNLSYLEDGEFAKILKGTMTSPHDQKRQTVVIKVPRVSAQIRKEKSEWHINDLFFPV